MALMRKLLAGAVLAATLTVGYAVGWRAREQAPVCRAQTEDSVITGCDYRAGAWYVK